MAELILDGTVLAALLVCTACAVSLFVWLVDRRQRSIPFHRALAYTAFLGVVALVLNTSTYYLSMLLVGATVAFIGGFLFMRTCSLHGMPALSASVMSILVHVVLAERAGGILDRNLPERALVSQALAGKLDAFTYARTGGQRQFVANETVGAALHAALQQTLAGKFAGMIMTRETSASAARGRKIQRRVRQSEPAVGGDPGEDLPLAVSRNESGGEADPVPPPLVAVGDGKPAGAGPTEDPASPESADLNLACLAGIPGLATADAVLADLALDHLHAASEASACLVALRSADREDPNIELSPTAARRLLNQMTPQERRCWVNAREKIKVDATLKLGDRSVAVVNGRLMEPGDLVTIPGDETNYVFRLVSVGPYEMYWSPHLSGLGPDERLFRLNW